MANGNGIRQWIMGIVAVLIAGFVGWTAALVIDLSDVPSRVEAQEKALANERERNRGIEQGVKKNQQAIESLQQQQQEFRTEYRQDRTEQERVNREILRALGVVEGR